MGSYLAAPITEKVSSDENDENLQLSYGASSMQGWRAKQEDAHNCILNFDTDTSFFAVYDGHGGSEVATYCAMNLPEFLKNSEAYKSGDIKEALEASYMGFDQLLTKEHVIEELKLLAGIDKTKDQLEEDPEEMAHLYEEAKMSIEELLLRYGRKIKEDNSISSGNSTAAEQSTKKLTPENNHETENSKENENDSSQKDSEQNSVTSVKPESNGVSNDSHASDETIFVSSKGKGKGKGLSNSIRKVVERTPEEIAREQKEIAAAAERKLRKESLRKRTAEELYKAVLGGDNKEDDDEDDEDDEEDEDFENGKHGDDDGKDEEDEDGDEDDGDDEEEEDEEDDEDDDEDDDDEEHEVNASTTTDFVMNMKEEPGFDSGCTAVVAVLRGNRLYVANVGDSRCVLSRRGEAVALTADHKPEDDLERTRIERAGGTVTMEGRVNGGLNLSRAIGDHAYKLNTDLGPKEQMITALPDIQTIDLETGDEFLVVACDGIWNSKSNQQVVDFIRPKMLAQPERLSLICEELFDECLAPNSMGDGTGCDNMTAIIVRLDRFLVNDSSASKSPTGQLSQPIKRPLDEDSSTESNDLQDESSETSKESKRLRIDEGTTSVESSSEIAV